MTKQRWFLVTNTENLRYFFECCMIVDKQGFLNDSYINDIQESCPEGYLVILSKEGVFAASALEKACLEDKHLTPCLIEIDIQKLNGSIPLGSIPLIPSNFVDDKNIKIVPAPISFNHIKKIIFSDKLSKNKTLKEFENIIHSNEQKYFVEETKLFIQEKKQTNKQNHFFDFDFARYVEPKLIDYKKAFSLGGALFLTYYQTKNGRRSCELFENMFNIERLVNTEPPKNEPFIIENYLKDMLSWLFYDTPTNELSKFYVNLFNEIALVTDSGQRQFKVLNYLKNSNKWDDKWIKSLSKHAQILEDLTNRTFSYLDFGQYFDYVIQEYESKKQGSSKLVMLNSTLFFRDKSKQILIAYHEKFSEEDYFLIATYWGIIEGVIYVPDELKHINGLRVWISEKMVSYLHNNKQNLNQFLEMSPVLLHKDKMFHAPISEKDSIKLEKLIKFLQLGNENLLTYQLKLIGPQILAPISDGIEIQLEKRPKITIKLNHNLLENKIINKNITDDNLLDFNGLLKLLGAKA